MSVAYNSAVLRDGPYLYAPMDDVSSTPRDISGNGRNATASAGTITTRVSPIAPGLNPGIRLSGTSPSISFPACPTADVASGGSFTVELWHSFEVVEGSALVMWESWASVQSRTQFGVDNDLIVLRSANGSGNQPQFNITVGTRALGVGQGVPLHLVWTMDGNVNYHFYLNGQVIAHGGTSWSTAGRQPASGNMRLGRSQDTFWGDPQGIYSNFAYYSNRVLTHDRILAHYRAGMGERRSVRRSLRMAS